MIRNWAAVIHHRKNAASWLILLPCWQRHLGAERPYDGVSDMAGLIVDEMYKYLADEGKAHPYTQGIEPLLMIF